MVRWFERFAPKLYVRLIAAVLLAGLHLLAFAVASEQRIHQPFRATSEAPYFSDPDATATMGWPRQPHFWTRLAVSRWDSQHYIAFALRGITSCPTDPSGGFEKDFAYLQCNLAWLPTWGLAGGAVADTTGIAPDVALVLLSILCAILVNLLWTSRPLVERVGLTDAWIAMLAFNLFPSAFYVVTPYSEAATIALVLTAFVCVLRDRWILAGLAIGAATALRISAGAFSLALACAAVYTAVTRRKAATPRWWRPLLAIPLSGSGLLVVLVFLQVFVGDWSAYFRARTALNPHRDFDRLVDAEWWLRGFNAQHMDSVATLACIAVFALVARELVKRFSRPEAIFLVGGSFIQLVLSIAALEHHWSLNRYLLLCPIFFLAFANTARKHTAVFVLSLLVSVALYWHVELCSYIAHGDPRICPCLGRFEFALPIDS